MKIQHHIINAWHEGDSVTVECALGSVPDKCPFCHRYIAVATPSDGHLVGIEFLRVVFKCPSCYEVFIGSFSRNSSADFILDGVSFGKPEVKIISKIIQEISPLFSDIYNESKYCESLNLMHVAGMGYRKALEFLLKDYLIRKYPEKDIEIKSKLLGRCINDDVENISIKEVAKRAVWVGNDETHYVRKHENKDIGDLTTLIDLTMHWIEMEVKTKQYLDGM